MRIILCAGLLFVICLVLPSVECDRKYRVSGYDERDKRNTRERYSRRTADDDDDDDDAPVFRRRIKDSDEDLSISRSDRLRRLKKEAQQQAPERKPFNKNFQNAERGRRFQQKKFQDSDEDYTDEVTDEDLSDSCVDKRGRRCDSDDVTDETNEDYTDEDDDSDSRPVKRVSYVKKFAHEKRKQKLDKETGNIQKLHKRAGSFSVADQDDSSEEVIVVPKRRRFVLEDDED